MQTPVVASIVLLLSFVAPVVPAAAQPAPDDPPPPVWTGSLSAGLAVTSGNSDTQNYNVGFAFERDPKARNLFKAEGLYLRGETDGELSVARLSLLGRDEYRFSERAFVFGQAQYLRDKFKEIEYLVSPTIGLGYRVVDRPVARLTVDAGVGGVWEKNTDRGVEGAGAVSAGQKLELTLSETASLTQLVTALWRMDDFADGLYTVGLGIAASVTTRSQIKAEVLNTFKNKPPDDTVKKNDVAVVLALVYKF